MVIGKAVRLVKVKGTNSEDCTAHTNGNNKFYDMIEIDGEFHAFYGRIPEDSFPFCDISYYRGKSGITERVYSMYDWDNKYREKLGKKYTDTTATRKVFDSSNIKSSGKDEDMYAPIDNKEIAKLVNRLQVLAKEKIDANYKVSSDQVTQEMVDEAQRYLNIASACLQSNDVRRFDDAIEGVFAIIPRKMDVVDRYLALSPNNMASVLKREQDLLDVMRGQIITPVNGQKVVTKSGNKHTILELNGITIEPITDKDKEEILKRMGNSTGMFVNAWKISNKKQETAYKAYCKAEGLRMRDCRLLWHGTRSENVWNILKTGLTLRPTNAVITGKMLGLGIYTAPDFLKSRNYTSAEGTTWASGRDKTGFMILHAVAYGNPYDLYSFGTISSSFSYKDLRKLKDANGNPYHCVHAHKGMNTGWSALRADEVVVYKDEQVKPLYLVEIR